MDFTCPICDKTIRIIPSRKGRVKSCGSKTCRAQQMFNNTKDRISNRIGEPVDSALHRLYIEERRGYRYIAKEFGVVVRIVMKLMKEFCIEPRERSEAIKTQWEGNAERKRQAARSMSERLKRYYENGGTPPSQLPGVGAKISAAKKENNWMKGRTGKLHHLWRGGKRWWRGKEWATIREVVLERDVHRCTRCGKSKDDNMQACGMPLSVHHIVPYRLSHDNSLDNLRTLCSPCHTWADYQFQYIL